MADAYRKALKRGEQDARRAVAEGRHPYLTDLEGIVLEGQTAGRESCGTLEIPLDMVVGTVTKGRQAAFSRTFLPLLDADSEFAIKWARLYDIQVEEGYRDPVRVTEFMHRFYVQEGNKRVSVLKYLGAHSVTAEVTRLYPSKWEGAERRLYGEFCEFWRACPVYDIEFSREGRYRRLAAAFGRDLGAPWPADAVDYLRQSYLFFASAYERAGGAHLDITPADAMLVYLGVYTQDRILDVPSSIVVDRLGRIWRELVMQGMDDDQKVDLVEAPDPAAAGAAVPPSGPSVSGVLNFFMGKTTYTERQPLRVCFIHDRPVRASGWAYAHDLGRQHLDEYFGGIVRTCVYEDRADEKGFMDAVGSAVGNGAEVVFSTSPSLMDLSVKAAVRYPSVRFLNCSIGLPHQLVRSYYGKMFEAKFLLGALAASLAENHRVGYRAYYPILGTIAEINAFAVGAALVDPRARVALSWSRGDGTGLEQVMAEQGVSVMSGSDVAKPWGGAGEYGLHLLDCGVMRDVAAPVWHWGRYYELIVRSLLHGSWDAEGGPVGAVAGTAGAGEKAVSYWYGLSSGVVDVRLSGDVPYTSKKLVALLRQGIVSGAIHPFEGELRSQGGVVQLAGFPALSSNAIVGMTWLADNVEGSLPSGWEISERARAAASVAGVPGVLDAARAAGQAVPPNVPGAAGSMGVFAR